MDTELQRSSEQWQPQREPDGGGGEADPDCVVTYEDLEDSLWPLSCPAAARQLLLGCLELLGAPMGSWSCSNAATPAQQLVLGAGLGGAGRQGAEGGAGGEGGGATARTQDGAVLQQLQVQEAAPWYAATDGRWQFLVRLLGTLVAAGPCRGWPQLGRALLLLHASQPSQPDAQARQEAARAAARQLLSQQRDSLLLWDAYAALEAGAGNTKAARKVYDAAFAMAAAGSGSGGAAAAQQLLPLLALHAADMELAAGAPARALHALLFALVGGAYAPFKRAPEGLAADCLLAVGAQGWAAAGFGWWVHRAGLLLGLGGGCTGLAVGAQGWAAAGVGGMLGDWALLTWHRVQCILSQSGAALPGMQYAPAAMAS